MDSFLEFKRNLIATIKDEDGAQAFRELLQPLIPDNRKEIAALIDIVKTQNVKIQTLETEVERLKQHSLNKTILISGLVEDPEKTTEAIVTKLCKDSLGVNLHPVDIDGIYRMTRRRNNQETADPIPPVIQLTLTTTRKKIEIMKNKKKLKGVEERRIYINERLTQRQSEIFAWARSEVKAKQVNAAWTREGTVFIKKTSTATPEIVKEKPIKSKNIE